MGNASSDLAETIVFGGGLERCQNLPMHSLPWLLGHAVHGRRISFVLLCDPGIILCIFAYIYTFLVSIGNTMKDLSNSRTADCRGH